MPTILVVDDEVKVRETIARQLTHAGYNVLQAATGKEALAALDRARIDLVITDAYMPEMDGIEFISRVPKHPSAAKVIVMSGGGHMDKESILEIASRLGAARTLEKPFGKNHLMDAVGAVLSGQDGLSANLRPTRATPAPVLPPEPK